MSIPEFGENCPNCKSSTTMITSTKFVDGEPVEDTWTCADCTHQWVKKIKYVEDQS